MKLHLVDISPHIYAGNVNKKAALKGNVISTPEGWQHQIIQTGGIAFLFNKIYEFAKRDLMVFVGDREATYRKGLNPNYKSGRSSNPEIELQKMLAEEILEDCGFQVVYEDNEEADDLIYSLVQKYKSQFEHIYVHTDDSDLFINVDSNVSILPASSRGKIVTRENYEYTVIKDDIVRYNGLTYLKMVKGDSSDKVNSLSKNLAESLMNIYRNPNMQPMLADPNAIQYIAKEYGGQVLENFLLVYPRLLDVEIDTDSFADTIKTEVWGQTLGNKKFKARFKSSEVNDKVANFFTRGLAI